MSASRSDARRARRGRARSRTDAARLGLAAGALLLGVVSLSAAALSDTATMGLGTSGIGFDGRFDLAVVSADGSVEQTSATTGAERVIDEAQALVPGRSVSVEIPVFNNTSRLAADTVFRVVARGGDPATAGVPDITPHLRFSAQDAAGNAIFTSVTLDQATGALGILAARGADPLADGATFVAGAAGSDQTLKLTIEYLDEPGVEALNGGRSALSVSFDATSVRP